MRRALLLPVFLAWGCPRPGDVSIGGPAGRPADGAQRDAWEGEAVPAPPPALPEGSRFVPQMGHGAPVWAFDDHCGDDDVFAVDADGFLLIWSADLRDVRRVEHLGVAGLTAAAFASVDGGVAVVVGTAMGGVYRYEVRLSDRPAGPDSPRAVSRLGADLPRAVSALAISPSGDRVAVATVAGVVLVRALDGSDVWARNGDHADKIGDLAFSPDGSLLAGAGADGVVSLWGTADGRPKAALAHDGPALSVAFSPGGGLIATGAGNRTLRAWQGDASAVVARAGGFADGVAHVAFLGDGLIFTADATGGIDAFAVPEPGGDLVPAPERLPGSPLRFGPLMSLSFARCNDLVIGGADGSVRIVPADGDVIASPVPAVVPHSLAISPDGGTAAAGLTDGTILLLDTASGREVSRIRGGSDVVTALAFAPDGTLAWSDLDGAVHVVWRDPEDSRVLTFPGHLAPVTALAFAPDGGLIASGGSDGTVLLWNPAGPPEPVRMLDGHVSAVLSLAFSEDGSALWSTGLDRLVWRWDRPRWRSPWRHPTDLGIAGIRVAALPGGRALVGTADGAVLRLDADGAATSLGPPGDAAVVAVVPSGGSILVAFADSGIRRILLPDALDAGGWTGPPMRAGDDSLGALAASPDGDWLLRGGRSIGAVAADGGERAWRLFVTPDGSLTVSPDGRYAATGSAESLVGFDDGSAVRRADDPAVAAMRIDDRAGEGRPEAGPIGPGPEWGTPR